MKELIAVGQLSAVMLGVLLRPSRGERIVCDFSDEVHVSLKQYGISSIPVRVQPSQSQAERDTEFRRLFMPGRQLADPIPGTELPTWKMLAMDRLSFWYHGDAAVRRYEYLVALNWDVAYVSADLNDPVTWALARHSGRRVVGVKAGSFRTREWYDLLKTGGVPFAALLVEGERDSEFLKGCGYTDVRIP